MAFLLAVAALAGCGDKPLPAGRVVQPAGEFSLVVPEGWSGTRVPGIDYLIFSAEPDSGARPTLFVDFVMRHGSLSNAVYELAQAYENTHRGYRALARREFETDSRLPGLKLTASRETADGLTLSTFHYLIADQDRVIGITASCAESVVADYEAGFDGILRSLQSQR